ncbi:MAG: DUF1643 domain-containing protein [Bacteroidota bacterium]
MKTNAVTKDAIFSKNRKHRYALIRTWNTALPMMMCIGLNPSVANEQQDDPTIRRVINFAEKWGFGGVYMCNLFSYITSYPEQLKITKNNSKNDFYLKSYAEKSQEVLCAWGRHKAAKERATKVLKMMHHTTALQINKDGSPKHPLYVKAGVERVAFPNSEF